MRLPPGEQHVGCHARGSLEDGKIGVKGPERAQRQARHERIPHRQSVAEDRLRGGEVHRGVAGDSDPAARQKRKRDQGEHRGGENDDLLAIGSPAEEPGHLHRDRVVLDLAPGMRGEHHGKNGQEHDPGRSVLEAHPAQVQEQRGTHREHGSQDEREDPRGPEPEAVLHPQGGGKAGEIGHPEQAEERRQRGRCAGGAGDREEEPEGERQRGEDRAAQRRLGGKREVGRSHGAPLTGSSHS